MESGSFGLILEPIGIINAINALGFHDSPKLRALAHDGFVKTLIIWVLCNLALRREKTWREPLSHKVSFVLGSSSSTLFAFKVLNMVILLIPSFVCVCR